MELLEYLTWPTIAAQGILAVGSLIVYRRFFSPISDIPGPPLASVSRFWHIGRIFAGRQNLEFIDLHDKYGYFVRISYDEVSVSHPDGVRKLLLASLPKGYWYAGLALPDYRFIAPMSVTEPKAKVELSKALATGYTMSNILQTEEHISGILELFFGWLDKYSESKKPMPIDDYIGYVTFDVVGEVVFSKPFGFLEAGYDIDNSISNSNYLSLFSAFASFYRHARNLLLTNPIMTNLQILPMGHVFNTTMKAVTERQKSVDARFDIVAHWFRTMEQHPDRLTLRNIYAQATNNIGAGADTVNCTLQTFLYYSLHNPEVMKKLENEMEQAQKNGLCQGKTVSFADAQSLLYLQAALKEALRFFTPVTMGLPRVAPAGGITIGDKTFPQGTILSVNPWVVHRSKELWGSDAREFNPDRWFRENVGELEKKYYIPFGAGYNSCPGHNLAKVELSKLAATMIRDYEFELASNAEWKWRANFTAVPHSWPVYVTKRSARA